GVRKEAPASETSSPRARSASVGWPQDSWICRASWGVSSTRVVRPAAQAGGVADQIEALHPFVAAAVQATVEVHGPGAYRDLAVPGGDRLDAGATEGLGLIGARPFGREEACVAALP